MTRENRRQAAEGEEQLTRTCDFGWVLSLDPAKLRETPGGLKQHGRRQALWRSNILPCAREPVVQGPTGMGVLSPPCFLQKLGLEVRGQRLATRFHRHQGVVCSQASAEHFAKVPLKQPGVPTCLPWTVGVSCQECSQLWAHDSARPPLCLVLLILAFGSGGQADMGDRQEKVTPDGLQSLK